MFKWLLDHKQRHNCQTRKIIFEIIMTYHTLFQDNITNFQSVNHSSSVQLLQANLLKRFRDFFDNFFALKPGVSEISINLLMRKFLSTNDLLKNEDNLDNTTRFIAQTIRGNLTSDRKDSYIKENKKISKSFDCKICGASLYYLGIYEHLVNCISQLSKEIVPVKQSKTLYCLYNKELEGLLTKRSLTEESLLADFRSLMNKITTDNSKKVCTKTECIEHKGWRVQCLGGILKNIVKNEKKLTRSYVQMGFNTGNYR